MAEYTEDLEEVAPSSTPFFEADRTPGGGLSRGLRHPFGIDVVSDRQYRRGAVQRAPHYSRKKPMPTDAIYESGKYLRQHPTSSTSMITSAF
jgi:hypothetical protein